MNKFTTIVVAGLGRCGTTMLFNAIRQKNEFVRDLANLNNPDFEQFQAIKTHDFAPDQLPPHTKCIYLFGNPIEIVLSAHGEKVNHDEHYLNLHSSPSKKNKFAWEDTLGLETNFDTWMQPQKYPLLTLRYETIWQNIGLINEFIGFQIGLPEQIERQTNINKPIHSHHIHTIKKTYAPLEQKINQAPDAKIWEIKPC